MVLVTVLLAPSFITVPEVASQFDHAIGVFAAHWLWQTGLVTVHVPLVQVPVAVPLPLGATAAVLSTSACVAV